MSFTKEEIEWLRECPRQHTVVIGQPRSGSTLLMRLMGLVGQCDVSGDRDVEWYKQLNAIWRYRGVSEYHGSLARFEKEDTFADTFMGGSRDQVVNTLRFSLQRMIMNPGGGGSPCKFIKITTLGFTSRQHMSVRDFVDFMRELHDHPASMPLQIVWLTRNAEDIVKSFQTREGPGQKTAIEKPEILQYMIKQQREEFRECYDLDDIVVKYEDLVADPKKILVKLKPSFYPKDWLIERVMEKKLR